MTSTLPHPSVQGFMARRGISGSALRFDGRLSITIDGKYRVQLRPAADGQITLHARVIELPDPEKKPAADQVIENLLNRSAGLMREHASTLCLEQGGQTIRLQRILAADISIEKLEAEIAEFTNSLDYWVRISKTL